MKIIINGVPVEVGTAGPDGNPIGTIISFMGTIAPADYLVCDGSTYPIAAYPKLAQFFEEQFGSADYFGGNGTTTFSVPDLRNLFLRGYHGDAEEELSAEIGETQNATVHPYLYNGVAQMDGDANEGKPYIGISVPNTPGAYHLPSNMDESEPGGISASVALSGKTASTPTRPAAYTSRPVNMAVLYCIKAISSASMYGPSLEEYDQDGWHVRKWSDGYMELDGTFRHIVLASDWTEWGSVYTVGTSKLPTYSYPLPMTVLYGEIFDVTYDESGGLMILYGNREDNTKTKHYGLSRGTVLANNHEITLHYVVTGRWK